MGNNKNSKTRRNRLLIALGCVGIIVASFFIYKYVYIYTERKKYDAATVAIQKVASDLRAQGIETEFTKGCGRTQEVYTEGTIFCNVSLNIKNTNPDENTNATLKNSLENNGFKLISTNGVRISSVDQITGIITYSLTASPLSCGLRYTETSEDEYTLKLNCGRSTRFKLF